MQATEIIALNRLKELKEREAGNIKGGGGVPGGVVGQLSHIGEEIPQ